MKKDILKSLPRELKSLKAYEKVEKKLNDVLKTDHRHKTIKEYMTCAWCQFKFQQRQKMMKELGFKDINQYSSWREVMGIMSQVKKYKDDHKK